MRKEEIKRIAWSRTKGAEMPKGMEGFKFYKKYMEIVRYKERPIPGHRGRMCEEDIYFNYKGEKYMVRSVVVPNAKGEVIYSAKFRYVVEKLS